MLFSTDKPFLTIIHVTKAAYFGGNLTSSEPDHFPLDPALKESHGTGDRAGRIDQDLEKQALTGKE